MIILSIYKSSGAHLNIAVIIRERYAFHMHQTIDIHNYHSCYSRNDIKLTRSSSHNYLMLEYRSLYLDLVDSVDCVQRITSFGSFLS
jgi:hypothetical protein